METDIDFGFPLVFGLIMTEAYSEPSPPSKMKVFVEIAGKPLTIFSKNSILDI